MTFLDLGCGQLNADISVSIKNARLHRKVQFKASIIKLALGMSAALPVLLRECMENLTPYNMQTVSKVPVSSFYYGSYRIPYSPENKPPPSLTSKFLHRYFYLVYKPPPLRCKKCTNSKSKRGDQQQCRYS